MQDWKWSWTIRSHWSSSEQKFTGFDYRQSRKSWTSSVSNFPYRSQTAISRCWETWSFQSVIHPTQNVERKFHGSTYANSCLQETGRCTGPALQASIIVTSQDTLMAIHVPEMFITSLLTGSILTHSSVPSIVIQVISGFMYWLKCCISAPVHCYISLWTPLSLLSATKPMGLMAFLDVLLLLRMFQVGNYNISLYDWYDNIVNTVFFISCPSPEST